jgi:hypothetical protein
MTYFLFLAAATLFSAINTPLFLGNVDESNVSVETIQMHLREYGFQEILILTDSGLHYDSLLNVHFVYFKAKKGSKLYKGKCLYRQNHLTLKL